MCAAFEGSEDYFFGEVKGFNGDTGKYHIHFHDGDQDENVDGEFKCRIRCRIIIEQGLGRCRVGGEVTNAPLIPPSTPPT